MGQNCIIPLFHRQRSGFFVAHAQPISLKNCMHTLVWLVPSAITKKTQSTTCRLKIGMPFLSPANSALIPEVPHSPCLPEVLSTNRRAGWNLTNQSPHDRVASSSYRVVLAGGSRSYADPQSDWLTNLSMSQTVASRWQEVFDDVFYVRRGDHSRHTAGGGTGKNNDP